MILLPPPLPQVFLEPREALVAGISGLALCSPVD